jgi:hypothetical protein
MKILVVTMASGSGKPYAEMIVDGEKTWEIRRFDTKVRGEIGIVDKDARLLGIVEIVDVKGPFEPKEIAKYQYHKSTLGMLEGYSRNFNQGKPLFVWVLANARRFGKPIKVDAKGKDTGIIEEVNISE